MHFSALRWALLVLAAACGEGSAVRDRPGVMLPAAVQDSADTTTPDAEPQPPWLSLPAGARYFERAGVQQPVLMRNVSAPSAGAFTPLFQEASQAGTSVVRLQITQGFGYQTLGMSSDGGVLASWAASWDAVLEEAERHGLGVIVVFTLWGDWNDGTPDLGWTHFGENPLSRARGGPAASPAELFADTETQRLWLGWLSRLIRRWSSRPNVIAWELFSELDLATGATEANATAFVEKAHQVVRAIDPWRPAFASTSDLPLISGQPWQLLWDSPGNDIVSVHPYDADLDRTAVSRVRSTWHATHKPVLIGESGLDAAAPSGTTLTSAPGAAAGLEHAIWAELVSGAASARALYWEDGYAVYYPATGLPLVTRYHDLEVEAARWLAGKDFKERTPVSVNGDPAVIGTAVAHPERISGWAREERLAPPQWSAAPLPGARVTVDTAPETPDAFWDITLTSPADGSLSHTTGRTNQGQLRFEIEAPFVSFAFDAQLRELAPPICPSVEDGDCVGPVYAIALNGSSLFADPECPAAVVRVSLTRCEERRRFALVSCPGDGGSPPRSCVSIDVSLDAQTGTGSYYDASGALFDVLITNAEVGLDDLDRQNIRSGTLGGSFRPSASKGPDQPFELSFTACSGAESVCLR